MQDVDTFIYTFAALQHQEVLMRTLHQESTRPIMCLPS